jgi:hypothetical protein
VSSGADCIISPGRISVSRSGAVGTIRFQSDSHPSSVHSSIHPSIHPSPRPIPMHCTTPPLSLRVPDPSITHHSPPTGLSVLLNASCSSSFSRLVRRSPFPFSPSAPTDNSEVLFLPLSSHVIVFYPKRQGKGPHEAGSGAGAGRDDDLSGNAATRPTHRLKRPGYNTTQYYYNLLPLIHQCRCLWLWRPPEWSAVGVVADLTQCARCPSVSRRLGDPCRQRRNGRKACFQI